MARGLFHLLKSVQQSEAIISDTELLKRYSASSDAAAVELLVRRHAGSVWGVCRSVLRSEADAEDAFQASFLLLLRHARSIRGSCAGAWLHRVAINASLRLKQRKPPEVVNEEPAAIVASPHDAAENREQAALVHEEVARLPDRYRLPVVLCDLEGHTHAEAAGLLRWPIGSVSGRLSRAHAILRERLARRGVASVVLAGVLTPSISSIAAVHRVERAVVLAAPASDSVSNLVQGVSSAMRIAKQKVVLGFAACAAFVVGGGAAVAWAMSVEPVPEAVAAPEAAAPPEAPIEGDWIPAKPTDEPPTAFPELKRKATDLKPFHGDLAPDRFREELPKLFGEGAGAVLKTDDTYRRLLKARLHQGTSEILVTRQMIAQGGQRDSSHICSLFSKCDDVRGVILELWANEPKELVPRLEELVVLSHYLVRFTRLRVMAGTEQVLELHVAEKHRLHAEADLWKALHPR